MWQKLKEQLPAIILTAALILGIAFWFNQKMAADMAAKQQAEIGRIDRRRLDAHDDLVGRGIRRGHFHEREFKLATLLDQRTKLETFKRHM